MRLGIYTSILRRRISAWNAELDVRVRRARVLMSSLEQSREMRTSSQRAPPLIISFALTSVKIFFLMEYSH